MIIKGNQMDFRTFKERYYELPVIDSRNITVLGSENVQTVRNQLTRWARRGLLIPLRKGMYVFNAHDRSREISELYIANQLYEPSYVSLETALSFYGIIPERVVRITSLSTRKTKTFVNPLGTFVYRHVQPEAFRGFVQIELGGVNVFMAEREKAIVDFVYFNLAQFSKGNSNSVELLTDGYRFQELGEVNEERLFMYAGCFTSKKLMRVMYAVKPLFRSC